MHMYRVLVIFITLIGTFPCFAQSVSGETDGHQYVDLGLPSGTLWATCNVGATGPTGNGDYFAWGEVTPKQVYSWASYTLSNGEEGHLIKYCFDKNSGDVDQKRVLETADDAASHQWGAKWRMPNREELRELIDNCNWEWMSDYNGSGKSGQLGTSKINGNKIFFPASGMRHTAKYKFAQMNDFQITVPGPPNGIEFEGEFGGYWSSELTERSMVAYLMNIGNAFLECDGAKRCIGYPIRAVVK